MHYRQLLFAAAAGAGFLAQAQAEHHLIYGAPVPSEDTVPLRRNINELQSAGGPQWDLYIQALKAMQEMGSDDELSYFQLSGIHGLPNIQWDNAGARQGSDWLGYCPHGEALFLPWHRPYVLLFEQQLVEHAIKIAEQYPDSHRDEYVEAAKSLRAPYWDWAADSAVPPASVPSTLNINVAGGDGVQRSAVSNPLQTYRMPSEALRGQYGRFDNRPQIYRCPAPYYNYPNSANANLRSRNLRGNLYAAFVHARTFSQFSQTGNNGVGLEQIHNWVHYDASCGQQFWQPDMSGFDPLFMLHHANVDRLWTHWQYIKPTEAIFSQSYYGQSRYASPRGAVITPDSELQPFFGTQTRMHTARSVASINGMGYSYEGLAYWNMSSADLQRSATSYINTHYGGDRNSARRSGEEAPAGWRRGAGSARRHVARGGETMQYFVRLEIDREEVERPSIISVFMGDTKAGDVAVMAQPAEGVMKGSFAIDDFVHEAFAKTAGSNGTVSSISHLVRLQVTKPDGSRTPLSSIASLNVSLEEVPFIAPKSIEELPKLGTPRVHQVTLAERED